MKDGDFELLLGVIPLGILVVLILHLTGIAFP